MRTRLALVYFLMVSAALVHGIEGGPAPLAALSGGGGDDSGGGSDDGGADDGDLADPDEADPDELDDPDAEDAADEDTEAGDEVDEPDAGDEPDQADEPDEADGGEDAEDGGEDDSSGSGGEHDDNSGSGSDDDGGEAESGDDNGGSGGNDDNEVEVEDEDDEDSDDHDAGNTGSAIQWEFANAETEAERSQLDQRDRIDTDGDGFRYRRGEFVALDLSPDDLDELKARGFEVIEQTELDTVSGTLLLLRGPDKLADEAALDAIDNLADPDSVGFNHLFESAAVQTSRKRGGTLPQRRACGCEIGLIDTGVAARLDNFRHVTLTQRAFNADEPQARLHGTAVAYLMAGTTGNPARATKIFVADIFSGPRETSGSSYALIKALDWLASQGVPVINISLSGPRNPAVASAIARITKRGHIVVAAAGNDGPAAPPVFPGAYDGVIGVTAVDAQNRVYRYANRGLYVDFSARGVAVAAIDAKGEVRDATGTSFAAPVIAARLAARLRAPDAAQSQRVVRELESEAQDLGPRGKDPIYGAGLIGESN